MVTLSQRLGFVTLKELAAKRISKRAPSSTVWLRAKGSAWLAIAGTVEPNYRYETILTKSTGYTSPSIRTRMKQRSWLNRTRNSLATNREREVYSAGGSLIHEQDSCKVLSNIYYHGAQMKVRGA
jgi:hypothetical protein